MSFETFFHVGWFKKYLFNIIYIQSTLVISNLTGLDKKVRVISSTR